MEAKQVMRVEAKQAVRVEVAEEEARETLTLVGCTW